MEHNTIHHEELIFVFGSNLAGRHGKGAALTASRFFQAEKGVGVGATGDAYAIPTKDHRLSILPLDEIERHIRVFFDHASLHNDKIFMMTRVGCGLSNYEDTDIVRIIKKCKVPDNVMLPGKWIEFINRSAPAKVIIAGGRDFTDYHRLQRSCEKIITPLLERKGKIEIVSGAAPGADVMGEDFAHYMANKHPGRIDLVRFPAAWNKFNKPAGHLRNAAMSWYGTHLIAFWDGESTGTSSMIDIAKRDGLASRILNYQIA